MVGNEKQTPPGIVQTSESTAEKNMSEPQDTDKSPKTHAAGRRI